MWLSNTKSPAHRAKPTAGHLTLLAGLGLDRTANTTSWQAARQHRSPLAYSDFWKSLRQFTRWVSRGGPGR